MTPFNINQYVRVKLTPFGRRIHLFTYTQLPDKYTPPKEDEAGYSEWQLWNLMQIFGPYIKLGGEQPFDADILIDTKS